MMKSVVLSSLLATSAVAFAPASTQQRTAVHVEATAAELESMIGMDIESGKKLVSLCMISVRPLEK